MAKTTAKSGDDRRTRRYNVRNFELYCSAGGLMSMLFKSRDTNRLPVVNFSAGGAQFLADKRFKNGQKLKIHLYVPSSSEAIVLDAQVCWCQQIPRRNAFRVGVKFGMVSKRAKGLQEIEAKIASLTIRVICPRCKSGLAVKKRHEGSETRCPKCHAAIKVSDVEYLPELNHEKKTLDDGTAADKSGKAAPKSGNTLNSGFLHFLQSTVKSRTHLDIIQMFSRGKRGDVLGSADVARHLSMSEKKVHPILRELVNRGVLKEIGVKTFNYDPVPASRKYLAEMASALASSTKRSDVIKVILQNEE